MPISTTVMGGRAKPWSTCRQVGVGIWNGKTKQSKPHTSLLVLWPGQFTAGRPTELKQETRLVPEAGHQSRPCQSQPAAHPLHTGLHTVISSHGRPQRVFTLRYPIMIQTNNFLNDLFKLHLFYFFF